MNHPPRIIARPRPSVPVLIALTLLAASVALLIVIAAAAATPACMSQSEARQQFPRMHLYWHGLHHCWDNRGPVRPLATRPSPRPYVDPNGNRAELAGVHWYPRAFDYFEPLDPPVTIGVVEYRWPGSTVMDGPVVVIEPLTVVAEAEFNEIDAQAGE
jgi:hypothetical protein